MEPRSHIVVVEDEATQRQLLVDYLNRQNFRVTGVDGGIALRKLFERELPALVLLDVGLPDEDGFTIARWSYEVRRCAMVTSQIRFTAAQKGRAVGAMEERTKCCGHLSGAGKEEQDRR
jgi:DNA-binding response OmpR family regulator